MATIDSRSGVVEDKASRALARYTVIAHLLDQAFRVPGTSWRFGLDPILGLIPGAGDLVTALIGVYGLWVARQLGAPASVLVRMLLNLTLDALAGAVPLIGDVFDFGFKAHVRNRVLLEKWLARLGRTRRGSLFTLLATLVALCFVAGGALWLAIAALKWLFRAFHGS